MKKGFNKLMWEFRRRPFHPEIYVRKGVKELSAFFLVMWTMLLLDLYIHGVVKYYLFHFVIRPTWAIHSFPKVTKFIWQKCLAVYVPKSSLQHHSDVCTTTPKNHGKWSGENPRSELFFRLSPCGVVCSWTLQVQQGPRCILFSFSIRLCVMCIMETFQT